MVTLEYLHYFIEVADCGSISKAAEKCFLERSNLSTIISRLENHFGVALFHRSNKGTTLTKEGEKVLDWAKRVLNEHDQLLKDFSNNHPSATTQHLVFYTSVAANEGIYAKPIDKLLQLYPTLSINVMQTKGEDTFELIKENVHSIGLFTLDEQAIVSLAHTADLEFIKLVDVQLAAYAAPESDLLKKYSSISLKTLSKMPLLLYTFNDQSPILRFLQSYFSNDTIINTVSTPTMLQYLLATGNHVSIGSAPPNTPPVFSGMKSVPIRDKFPLYFGMVLQKNALGDPVITSLIDVYCELLHLPLFSTLK